MITLVKLIAGVFTVSLLILSNTNTIQANPAAWANPNNRNDIDYPINKKVISVIFNPILESKNNQRLIQYKGWADPIQLETQYIQQLRSISGGVVNYQIVQRINNLDQYPIKSDGFKYTDQSYLNVIEGGATRHYPDIINYNKLINDFDLCGKRNRGEIDEVWIWGGPWFGFYEATMAGPNSFNTNGPPITSTSCNKQLHVMGFSYERQVQQMVHNMGHRTEGTMKHLFGSWQQNSTSHLFNQFILNDYQSPNYNYSGCGTIHYPPNGTSDYDYDNTSSTSSTCNDWYRFPNLTGQKTNISCFSWGCGNQSGSFEAWWLAHIPKYRGISNGKWSNWWKYILDFEKAITYNWPNPTATPIPTSTPTPPAPTIPPVTLSQCQPPILRLNRDCTSVKATASWDGVSTAWLYRLNYDSNYTGNWQGSVYKDQSQRTFTFDAPKSNRIAARVWVNNATACATPSAWSTKVLEACPGPTNTPEPTNTPNPPTNTPKPPIDTISPPSPTPTHIPLVNDTDSDLDVDFLDWYQLSKSIKISNYNRLLYEFNHH